MSTGDVPGANPANKDELAMGCWAEHTDGSMIFVESTEGGYVVYSIFDMGADPPFEYRDRMAEQAFKKQFQKKKDKWVWHDKTPFPWDRVVDSGIPPGSRYPSAQHLASAAQRVAESRQLHGHDVDPDEHAHKTAKEVVDAVVDKLQSALDSLRS